MPPLRKQLPKTELPVVSDIARWVDDVSRLFKSKPSREDVSELTYLAVKNSPADRDRLLAVLRRNIL